VAEEHARERGRVAQVKAQAEAELGRVEIDGGLDVADAQARMVLLTVDLRWDGRCMGLLSGRPPNGPSSKAQRPRRRLPPLSAGTPPGRRVGTHGKLSARNFANATRWRPARR